MDATNVTSEPRRDWLDERRVLSECWIYTGDRGLRAVTLHGNGSTLALDGRRLYRWNVMDESDQSIVAQLYSADPPSHELCRRVARQAVTRFAAD